MPTVIVLESNAVLRRAIAAELADLCELIEAPDERAAMTAAGTGAPDAFVVGASFVAYLDELGRKCPRAARIVIAEQMTERVAQTAVDAGFAHRLITAPWSFQEVRDAVVQLCDVATIVSNKPIADDVADENAQPRRSHRTAAADPLARLHDAMRSARQKRKHPRIKARLEVKVQFPTWNLFRLAYTLNISRGGILCQLDREPAVGDEAGVQILLPDGNSVSATARVKRVTEHEHTITAEVVPGQMPKRNTRYEVGLEFTALDGRDDSALEAVLKKLQKAYWDAPTQG